MSTVSDAYGMRVPRPWKYADTVACTNPDLIVGLELETENCRNSDEAYSRIGSPLGIDVKTDNSLRVVDGNLAYEFITKPTMMKNVLATLGEFFKQTGFNDDNYSDRCSVHVHVNCTDMTFEQVSAVALIYTVVEQILFEFVNQRPGNKEGWSRDTNIYCVPWNQCRDHLNLVYNFTKNPAIALRRWQKYTALNLLPLTRFGTMEWRHMHGTADMAKLTTWLNIIGAIYKHAKTTPFEDLVKDVQGLNTESHYGKFFDTVLGGQLPYNDTYRQAMEEGCILAKYSMINWSLEKNHPERAPKKAVAMDWAGIEPERVVEFDDIQEEEVAPPRGLAPRVARNWAPPPQDVAPVVGNNQDLLDALARIRADQQRDREVLAQGLVAPVQPAPRGGFIDAETRARMRRQAEDAARRWADMDAARVRPVIR